MYALLIALASAGALAVLLVVTVAIVDYLRWKTKEQGTDFLVKVVDRQRHSLKVRKEMLAELIARGEIIKFRLGHRWIKVGENAMHRVA